MKLHNIFVALFISVAFFSCDDYLELEPISLETSNSAYESASQIEAALVGVYESFQSSEYYVWDNLLFQDVRSDNCYAGGDNPEIFQLDYLNIAPTHSRVYKHWSNMYNAISKANLVLYHIDNIDDPLLTEVRKNQIKGEALFLRSYHYFTLVKLWGGVPLITSSITSTEPEAVNIPRATTEEIFTQITSDLKIAASLLPDAYGNDAGINKARATAGAANALAAKAYAQQPNPDYEAVLDHIEAVESSSANYQLIDYNLLFDGNNYNNAESIIEVQYLGGNEGSYGPQLLLPPSISGDSWRKFVTPSVDLVNAFDAEGDTVRRNAGILFESVQWVDEFWGNAAGASIPFGYKWKNASGWASADNVYLIRYGDIVLLKAEALNETNKLQDAVAEVNKIRTRAQLPDLTTAQSDSKQTLRATILNERRLELFLEGQRWDDLARFNVLVSTMNNLVEVDLRTGKQIDYGMTEAKKLLPIPQQELDRNPALKQNPL